MYDGASDSILYSLCNSQDTPIFPADKSAAFELQPQFPPYPGTHVSVIGYIGDKGIETQIFYQTKDGHIVEGLYECNETGHYKPVEGQEAFKLTDVSDIPKPKVPTDLTALLFGAEGGIRLYYKEETNSSISSIKYKKKEIDRWVAGGPAQPYSSVGSHAAGNQLGDELDIFVSTTLPKDEALWEINAVPFPLYAANLSDAGRTVPVILSNMTYSQDQYDISFDTDSDPGWSFEALDPLAAPLGLTFGAGETMSIFYVGKDQQLRQVRREQQIGGKNNSFKWSNATRPGAKAWPAPDDTSAHFGVAYDAQADHIWVYYMSNNTMTQLYQPSKGQWRDAVALPKSSQSDSGSGSGGLSKGAKLGIGIGVGLGVPLLLVAIAAYLFYHSRSSRKNRAAENAALNDAHAAAIAPPSHPGSPAPRYTSGYWQPPPPGHQPHDGPWPQHQPGVPYSDHNGYIKPEAGYGWGNGGSMDHKLQQQQQQFPGQVPHHSPPPQGQPVFEMSNNQVPVPPQEMPGEVTTTATATTTEVPGPHPR
ncbi:hypothetical protein PG991_006344 [Apiospora marii]|uniref:Fucose-specific lectin n=1 Tax=Apiospora marii TaxID=335849 RepID=A0ABR1SBS8_9PEZI